MTQPSKPLQTKQPNPQIAIQRTEELRQFSGPVPPPEALEHYSKIHPDLPDRMMRMAEQQAAHRQEIESRVVNAQIADSVAMRSERKIGQRCALFLTSLLALCGLTAILKGHEISGAFLGASGLAAIITAFIKGTYSKNELEQKETDQQVQQK